MLKHYMKSVHLQPLYAYVSSLIVYIWIRNNKEILHIFRNSEKHYLKLFSKLFPSPSFFMH